MNFMTKIFKKSTESEKALEARFVREVETRGGQAIKLTSQFHRGLPDRLAILPFHTIIFVEFKSTGEQPRPLQVKAMDQIRALKFSVRVVDSTATLNDVLEKIDERIKTQREESAEFNANWKAAVTSARKSFTDLRKKAKREQIIIKRLSDEV